MIRICFVCLGNICRSPMAEVMMKSFLKEKGEGANYYITSRGTSSEEEGNDIYPPAKKILDLHGIEYDKHFATKIVKEDYNQFDYFVCMEKSNIDSLFRIFQIKDYSKIILLLDRDISDPWYTRNFEITYQDISKGIKSLYEKLSMW